MRINTGPFVRLATILSLAGLDGAIPIAASAGLFKIGNAITLGLIFMSGPTAMLTAALMAGEVKKRMLTALLAGITATIVVILSAGFGPILLRFVNLRILRIAGGIAVICIGLVIIGAKIPERIPLTIMAAGAVLSLLIRLI